MKNFGLALSIALACTLAPIAAIHAQEARPSGPEGGGRPGGGRAFPRRNPFMVVFDTNGDGVIDETEIANAAAALKKLDTNGDGKLTEDELQAVMPGRGGGRTGGDSANNVEQMVNDLMKFDKNGDGKLSKEELPERMKSLMERGDTDKDGFLSREELRKLFQTQNNAGAERGGEEHEH